MSREDEALHANTLRIENKVDRILQAFEMMVEPEKLDERMEMDRLDIPAFLRRDPDANLADHLQPELKTDAKANEVHIDDPWVHRTAGMRCRTCVFYVPKVPGDELTPGRELGRCRRSAPTMKGFPAVFPADWCGEHRLDENKL